MKKLIISIFALAFFILLGVSGVNADRLGYEDQQGIHYFKKVDNKWIDYKAIREGKNQKDIFYYYYNTNNSCETKDILIEGNCVYTDDSELLFSEYYSYKIVDGKEYLSVKVNKNYYENSLNVKDGVWIKYYDDTTKIKDIISITYNDNSKNSYQSYERIKYYKNDNIKSIESYIYDLNGNFTTYNGKSYYLNGVMNIKMDIPSFYSKPNTAEYTEYIKYDNSGDKETYKMSYYKNNGLPTKLITYAYNNSEKTISEDVRPFKYVTIYKDKKNKNDVYPAKIITKNIYDNSGILAESYKVKSTIYNTKNYTFME